MGSSTIMRLGGLAAGVATLALPIAATAQGYPAPGYPSAQQGYPGGYDPRADAPPYDGRQGQGSYAQGDDGQDGYEQGGDDYAAVAPDGYDPGRPPPPPPGYRADPNYAVSAQADQRYGAYVADWAQRYCVRSRGNAGTGAVIGGVFGALLGSGLAGWRDRGAGAVIGGLAGAGAGAAIGSSSGGSTSPGCPPGYVVRGDAPAFAYDGYGGAPYYYAAPGWYRPWIYAGGRWDYRPYPYHDFYYRTYGYGRLGGPGPRYGWQGGGWGGRGYYPGYRGYRRGW